MCKACEKNPFVLEKTPKPHRDDHILHLRLQYAAQSTTCLGLPKKGKEPVR
jgi:hypothetical protein